MIYIFKIVRVTERVTEVQLTENFPFGAQVIDYVGTKQPNLPKSEQE